LAKNRLFTLNYGLGVKLKIFRKFRLSNLNNRKIQRIDLKTG